MKEKILKIVLLICLIWLAIVSVHIVSSLSENLEHKVDELGSVMFDGTKVTFYYDNFLKDNNGIYFSNDTDKYVHSSFSPTIMSKDGKTILYVEFTGDKKVVYEDNVVDPIEIIKVRAENIYWNIKVYILENGKQYYQIGVDEPEYSVSTCLFSLSNKSEVCNARPDIDAKEVINMIFDWDIVYDESFFSEYDYTNLIIVYDNRQVIGGFQKETVIQQAIDDDTIFKVNDGAEITYYQLNELQIDNLKEFLNHDN